MLAAVIQFMAENVERPDAAYRNDFVPIQHGSQRAVARGPQLETVWSTLPNIGKLHKPLNMKATKVAIAARNKKLQIVTRGTDSRGKKTVAARYW
ncbi:hypothetical protein AK812_SmicGene3437 [Symbiodinium microadriaticum]|uniref:Uncharacterized protein n=1 Tax=Symbiodinium microadriaticum TaxID=2951 RepID=A0A1Q9EYS3_SYMMI|nr:hypothetical protein AK812_SmicGene3437 [Symbiodinium microadriaticum]CAE7870834.1 unnamed protein product [Symbiodinium sp. KB8]